MEILIDSREKDKLKVKTYFEDSGFRAKIDSLPVGDLVNLEKSICIERKTITDFYNSIISKRVFVQAANMKANFENCYIIVIGRFIKLYIQSQKLNRPALNIYVILGAIASISSTYKIPILFVDNTHQYLYLSKKIIEKTSTISHPKPIFRIKMSDEDVYVNMLSCIPKVGQRKARLILSKIPFKTLVTCDNVNDLKIPGVGEKVLHQVLRYVNIKETFIKE